MDHIEALCKRKEEPKFILERIKESDLGEWVKDYLSVILKTTLMSIETELEILRK